MGQFWVKSVATLNIQDKVATFDQFGSPGHQMIQAMKSRRDKSSCKQVETSPWGLNGKEDERAKQQLASCLLPTKQHVWEYELLQKETQPQPFTFTAMG